MIISLYMRRINSVASLFLLNLSVCNVLFSISMPFWIIETINKKFWGLGMTMCKLSSFSSFLNLNCSTMFLIIIVADRAITVRYTMMALQYRTVRRGHIASIVTWLVAITISSLAYRNRELRPRNYYYELQKRPMQDMAQCSVGNFTSVVSSKMDDRCMCSWTWHNPKAFLVARLIIAVIQFNLILVTYANTRIGLMKAKDLSLASPKSSTNNSVNSSRLTSVRQKSSVTAEIEHDTQSVAYNGDGFLTDESLTRIDEHKDSSSQKSSRRRSSRIFWVNSTTSSTMTHFTRARHTSTHGRNQYSQRDKVLNATNKQILGVTVVYFLCWFPRNLLIFLQLVTPTIMYLPYFLPITRLSIVLAYSHPILIPIAWIATMSKGITQITSRRARPTGFNSSNYQKIRLLNTRRTSAVPFHSCSSQDDRLDHLPQKDFTSSMYLSPDPCRSPAKLIDNF